MPRGVMIHSTGANNPYLRRYVPLPEEPINSNNWNQFRPGGRQVCVHGFVGKYQDGTVGYIQTLPYDMRGWHAGGSANNDYIGIEVCEDALSDETYFRNCMAVLGHVVGRICFDWNICPRDGGRILCHADGYKSGIASNHADIYHWFKKFNYTMEDFINEVESQMYEMIRDIVMEVLKESGEVTWGQDEIYKAKEVGITDGSNPRRYCTRQEAMIMALRAYEKARE